jgi:hypothetical protein
LKKKRKEIWGGGERNLETILDHYIACEVEKQKVRRVKILLKEKVGQP